MAAPQPISLTGRRPIRSPMRCAEGHGAVIVTGHFGTGTSPGRSSASISVPSTWSWRARTIPRPTTTCGKPGAGGGSRHLFGQLGVLVAEHDRRTAPERDRRPPARSDCRTAACASSRFSAYNNLSSGPFVLARLAEAPLIPVFVPRLGTRHYAIRVGTRQQLRRACRDSAASTRS